MEFSFYKMKLTKNKFWNSYNIINLNLKNRLPVEKKGSRELVRLKGKTSPKLRKMNTVLEEIMRILNCCY